MEDNNLSSIICPACGERMEQISMPAQGVIIDVCTNGCGGVYLDASELAKFDEPDEDISPLIEALKGKEFKKTDEFRTRICPVCGAEMKKHFTSSKHETEIDECYSCGGKFLDYRELEKIRAEYSSDKLRAADVLREALNSEEYKSNILPVLEDSSEKLKKGALTGAAIGVIISAALYVKYYNLLSNMPVQDAAAAGAAVITGICLICAGIGALISKASKSGY